MKYFFSLTIAMFCFLKCCFAQQINPVLDKFDFESGLSSNEILCIAQDADNFLWVGTKSGLNRYDGNSFVQYFKSSDSNSIADNRINALCVLRGNILAIGTAKGLNFFNTHTGSCKKFYLKDTTQLFFLRNYFESFCTDRNGNLWASTQTNLLVFNKRLQLIRNFSGNYTPADVNRRSIQWIGIIDTLPNGNVLVSQDNEFVTYDIETFGSKKISILPFSSSELLNKSYSVYLQDALHRLWFTKTGVDSLFLYNQLQKKLSVYPLFKNSSSYFRWFSSLYSFDNNTFYLHVADTGFFKLILIHDSFTVKHINNLPPSNDVSTFFHDNQNNLWIGTQDGLYEWSDIKNQFRSINFGEHINEKQSAEADCFLRNGDEIYIGTYGNSLYSFNTVSNTLQHINLILTRTSLLPEVWNICSYKKDTLLIGTQEGLLWFAPLNKTYGRLIFPHPSLLDSFPITTQFTDRKKNVWMGIGLGHGVICFQSQSNSFTLYNDHSNPAFPLRHPTAIAEDENADLWMGTQRGGGLVKWTRANNSFSLISANAETQFNDDRINSIYADHHGSIWLGTNFTGIIRYDINKKAFENFGKKNGLSNENIFDIDGSQYPFLWITTPIGLNCLNALNGNIESFFKKDGLPTNAMTGSIYFDSTSGIMYAGYASGMVNFDAKKYFSNKHIPSVFIDRLEINDKAVNIDFTKPVSLNYKENNITVSFTAVDLINGPDLKFRYRLNAEENWNEVAKNRQINFSNLSPGNYRLFIQVANKAGLWNENSTTLIFAINSPFWETWWFYLLFIIAIIFIAYSLYRFRIHQLQHVQEMRNRIAQDLHDDIGGTMTAINLTNELAIQNLHAPATAKKLLLNISDDLKNVGETLDDIVWTVNPKNDSMEEVMARMRRYASYTWEAAGIEFEFEFEKNAENIRLNMEQRHDLYLIFKEAVSNIAKHSKCTHASSSVILNDHLLEIEIKDNGNGFDINAPSHRNGLENMKSRALKWHGDFKIQSSSQQGTTICLLMPVTQKGD